MSSTSVSGSAASVVIMVTGRPVPELVNWCPVEVESVGIGCDAVTAALCGILPDGTAVCSVEVGYIDVLCYYRCRPVRWTDAVGCTKVGEHVSGLGMMLCESSVWTVCGEAA